MNSADKVIEKFGGQSALARLLGKRPSVVQYWSKAGIIPSRWHSPILKVAKEQGIDLSPSDFTPFHAQETASYQKSPPSTFGNIPARIPYAKWPGGVTLGDVELPCYVLDDGRRVISRRGATDALTDKLGGGNLEHYIGINALKEYLPGNVEDEMIEFSLDNVVHKTVKGMPAEVFLDICKAYVKALGDGALDTDRQRRIALKAAVFLSACAKVGLIALIDEATGYQYERSADALQLKLKAFLAEEMRQWEKTFPNELWKEFGRLTHWTGSVQSRPKYWGKLVMELVYDYLDKDVSDWLKQNAPKPRGNLSYHRWLTEQYGLRKLLEHIWMLIGMASACRSLPELKEKMAQKFGRQPVQYTLYLPSPDAK